MHRTDQVFIYFNFPWLFGAFPLSPEYESDEESVDVSLAYVDDTVYPYNGVSAVVPYVDDLVVFCNPSLWPIVWPHLFD